MRPLAVLILVLGAIASLFFAFMSLAGSREEGTVPGFSGVVKPNDPREAAADIPLRSSPNLTQTLTGRDTRVGAVDTGPDRSVRIGFIKGTVLNPEKLVVRGASVRLVRMPKGLGLNGDILPFGDASTPIETVQETVTLLDGTFAFHGIEPGRDWGLKVQHKDYAPAEEGPITVPEEGGVQELIYLAHGNTLSGKVTMATSGAPIEAAELTLASPMAAFRAARDDTPGGAQTTTDSTGFYLFEDSGRSIKTLTVRAPEYATQILMNFDPRKPIAYPKTRSNRKPHNQVMQELQKQDRSKEYNISMVPGRSIAGVVLAPDRSGMEGVEIQAVNQVGQVGSQGITMTTTGGEFLIEDLGPGAYTITCKAEGYHSYPLRRVDVGSTGIEIVLASQGGISGRIVDATTGKPVSTFKMKVRAHNPTNMGWGHVVRKQKRRRQKQGTFTIMGITEGEYVLEASAEGYASSFSEPFEVVQGIVTRDITVRLTKGGLVKGKVIDGTTGKPIAGAEVRTNENNYINSEFMNMLNAMGQSAITKDSVKTGKDGSFQIALMTPDTYQVQASRTGYSSFNVNDIRVLDGSENTIPTISLFRGARITGIVYGKDNSVLSGATVQLNPASNTLHWTRGRERSDANGAFTFLNVQAGEYELSATRHAQSSDNLFSSVLDMRNSQRKVIVAEGGTYVFDVHFDGARN